MRFKLLYAYKTKRGTFYIGASDDGRFHPIFDGESLGSYWKAFQAAEDLAGGHSEWPSTWDPSELDIPMDLAEWTPLVPGFDPFS